MCCELRPKFVSRVCITLVSTGQFIATLDVCKLSDRLKLVTADEFQPCPESMPCSLTSLETRFNLSHAHLSMEHCVLATITVLFCYSTMNTEMPEPSDHRISCSPRLAKFIAALAAVHNPGNAIDPVCDDWKLTVLCQCHFIKSRRALYRHSHPYHKATLLNLQTSAYLRHDIDLAFGDFTCESHNQTYDLVTTACPLDGPVQECITIVDRCLDMVAPNGICLMLAPYNLLAGPAFHRFRHRVLHFMSLDAVDRRSTRTIASYSLASHKKRTAQSERNINGTV